MTSDLSEVKLVTMTSDLSDVKLVTMTSDLSDVSDNDVKLQHY